MKTDLVYAYAIWNRPFGHQTTGRHLHCVGTTIPQDNWAPMKFFMFRFFSYLCVVQFFYELKYTFYAIVFLPKY